LRETILGVNEPHGEEEVVFVLGVDMGDPAGIPNDPDLVPKRVHSEYSVDLGQIAEKEPMSHPEAQQKERTQAPCGV